MSWQNGSCSVDRETHGIEGRSVKGQKRVFASTDEVFTAWAKQETTEGRNRHGRVFFKGRTVYSYRESWPLAYIMPGAFEGQRVALVNTENYSTSTTQHLRGATSAFAGIEIETTRLGLVTYLDATRHTPEWSNIRSNDMMKRWTAAQEEAGKAKIEIVNHTIGKFVGGLVELVKPRKRWHGGYRETGRFEDRETCYWDNDTCENRCASLDDSHIKRMAEVLGVSLLECERYSVEAMRAQIVDAFAKQAKGAKGRSTARLRSAPERLARQVKRGVKGWRSLTSYIDDETVAQAFSPTASKAKSRQLDLGLPTAREVHVGKTWRYLQRKLLEQEIDRAFEAQHPEAHEIAGNIHHYKERWSPHFKPVPYLPEFEQQWFVYISRYSKPTYPLPAVVR